MVNKKIAIVISFLFLFGIVIQLSHSSYILQLDTGNKQASEVQEKTSALLPGEEEQFQQDQFLIIYHPDQQDSMALKKNVARSLMYMKKTYKEVTLLEIPKDLSVFKSVIITFPLLDNVKTSELLTTYVFDGGKLFFAIRPELNNMFFHMYRKLGIYEVASDYKESFGIKMESDLLLKGKGLTIEDDFLGNSSLVVQLNETCKVFAKTLDGTPLLWETNYGKGKFLVFNGTMLQEKINSGFIAGALSYVNDDFIYPIMNTKVVFIDDFPAPFPEGYNEQIYKEYKRDIPTFFRDVWWEDMEKAGRKYDVKYTGVLIESYSNQIKGPFKESFGEENLKFYGRELLDEGGEIGVHGYNHQSLTTNPMQIYDLGYRIWESENDMFLSLKEVNDYFHEIFPNYQLRTYVPPSNILSEDGKKAIKKAIPSINIIASLYQEDPEHRAYVQEYETKDGFIEMPRLTSDYYYGEENKWMIANYATLFGSFSHFIHPDDILDKERSKNNSWSELYKRFSLLLHDVKTNYPWMRSMTASESADSLVKFLQAKVYIQQQNNKINVFINHFSGELYFLLRTDKKITTTKNCTVEKVSEDHYLVKATSSKLEIGVGGT